MNIINHLHLKGYNGKLPNLDSYDMIIAQKFGGHTYYSSAYQDVDFALVSISTFVGRLTKSLLIEQINEG